MGKECKIIRYMVNCDNSQKLTLRIFESAILGKSSTKVAGSVLSHDLMEAGWATLIFRIW